MRLHEELYIDITVQGKRCDIDKFIAYITSGELDDFFEITSDLITYDDEYNTAGTATEVKAFISNDSYGFEIDSFNPEEFLDAFCAGGYNVFIQGHLYDIDDEEYRFVSPVGETSYDDASKIHYKDELDFEAQREEYGDN